MTLFKLFNVSADHVEIDKTRIARPGYIAPSVWADFWSAAASYNRSGEDPYDVGWKAAMEVKKDDHE